MDTAVRKDDLSKMSVEELEALIRTAQEHKRKRQTPMPLINGHRDSVVKHVKGVLVAVGKMLQAEGVPATKWADVAAELDKLSSLDRAKEEASKLKVTPRRRATRK